MLLRILESVMLVKHVHSEMCKYTLGHQEKLNCNSVLKTRDLCAAFKFPDKKIKLVRQKKVLYFP